MKKLKALIVVLLLVVVALGVFVFLLATGKVSFVKTDCSCKESNTEITVDEAKLKAIKSSDYNIIKGFYGENLNINLLSNGKVNFDLDRDITNINNAIDIETLDNNLYILTKDGNIYKYYLGVTKEFTLEATKVEEFKDIKKIVSYSTRAKNAGGCNYIIGIDKDNNYKTIVDFCV